MTSVANQISYDINCNLSYDNINDMIYNINDRSSKDDYTVQDVLIELKKTIKKLNWKVEKSNNFKESNLLKLDCNKALNLLNWTSTLNFKKTISYTSLWYLEYLNRSENLKAFSKKQILEFDELRKNKN